MNVETKYVEAVTLAALSADAPDASRQQTGAVVQALFEQVINQMEAATADRTTPIARYQPTPPNSGEGECGGGDSASDGRRDSGAQAVRVTAGYALTGDQVPGLQDHVLPATHVAAVVHHGPMNTISTAYQELARWAESTGRPSAGLSWREHYLEANGDDQSHWIVEVQLELD
ncbi:GyrI-like domain-containing protein [Streptomyces sp. SID13031]|uniref:GyrI-like domain-containing protein n=1 Tax=Streptomyces sp. SID13031 TaxID=2706046 RepID=UPI0013C8D3FC|nr:GyrI-like domain-containing protein [Streptomyces sp. SID13031]